MSTIRGSKFKAVVLHTLSDDGEEHNFLNASPEMSQEEIGTLVHQLEHDIISLASLNSIMNE